MTTPMYVPETSLSKSGLKKFYHEYYSGTLEEKDFKSFEKFQQFREDLKLHKVMSELFDGSSYSVNFTTDSYEEGWESNVRSDRELDTLTNLAKIVVDLREQINQLRGIG